jgi:hypothetical protein
VAQASCPPNASGQAANSIIQRQAGRRRYFRAGDVGTLRGFTGTNASFAPAFSPVSGARRIGQVIIANPRKNSANLWQGT